MVGQIKCKCLKSKKHLPLNSIDTFLKEQMTILGAEKQVGQTSSSDSEEIASDTEEIVFGIEVQRVVSVMGWNGQDGTHREEIEVFFENSSERGI